MLNRFIQSKCKESISCIPLTSLSGKKIAVDISIYLYKYLSENALLENLYLMISIFREHNIIPIFIFDGKPPVEKIETIEMRRKMKNSAREEYYRLKLILDGLESLGEVGDKDGNDIGNVTTVEIDEDTYIDVATNGEELRNAMKQLKKKFVILKQQHIQDAKSLLQAYGVTYYEAPGEADILCANLVTKNIVYACLSEDTDMFVYGCSRVLRYLSLTTSKVILYDFNSILKTLNMDMDEFKKVSIMFGCDYSQDNKSLSDTRYTFTSTMTIFHSYKMFTKYKDKTMIIMDNDFYDWVIRENESLANIVQNARKNIRLFDIHHIENLEIYDQIKIMNGPINRPLLIEVMKKENFIFMN
jgi:5'-3' exonuclease